ncbi:YoaK family protein [Erysipelothrix sp. strain 2 (EsS2-6-Brazil)]|uniref:YoaK family protein n=1 Tax=Erysipelothrix sp. strain 2 (EsS2-6-Brazil) TaxID=2500549 RepID=UPI0013786EC8|nr:YoaK family protein [Erysipelothrix sp. strain 2 (EsS2-6-Brazil)]MBK2401784.1 DUF1275 domain-containing protein [Erysipelothrix sp. strain 2 (EsS2-6-Brazil)]NBA00872.1 DUF1275 domain-containing protein [Erysipelothrix rhusiopathiae]
MKSIDLQHENSRFAYVFSFISGYLDVLGILAIGGVFLSFMSGNSTRLGIHLINQEWIEVLRYVLVLISFVLGSFIGNLFCTGSHAQSIKKILELDILCLVVALAFQFTTYQTWSFPLISFAMGIQNKAQVEVNNATIGKGFMTGVLYGIGEAFARFVRKETSWHEVSTLILTWFLFFLGAMTSTCLLCFINATLALGLIVGFICFIYLSFCFYHQH